MKYFIKPWAHQLEAINIATDRYNYGLFFEQGTGKTCALINILRVKYGQYGRILKTLIICPKVVIPNWKDEFGMHSRVQNSVVCLDQLSGPKKLQVFKKENTHKKIFIINYEFLLNKKNLEGFLDYGFEVIVADESHKIKTHNAKRTKALIQLADKAKHKYILSGTPILNNMMDIFSQFRFMDGGVALGQNYWGFRGRYFYDKNVGMPKHRYFPNWVPREDTGLKLKDIIANNSMRVLKEDCLDLPELIEQVIKFDLGVEQKRIYDSMEKHLVSYFKDREESKEIVASMALTKSLRLLQISSGVLKADDGTETVIEKDLPRVEALHELLETLTPEHKVLVWASFKENYKQIIKVCNKLKIEYVEVHGGIKDKQKAIDEFRTNPRCRVFVANPKAGGIGINLIESDYSIYFNHGYSLEEYLQSKARNYRGGQIKKTTHISLVAKDTLDEVVLEALKGKHDMAESLLKAIRSKKK